MFAFDDLTMAEVDEISETCLGGKSLADETVDPLRMAGAVMWMTQRRNDPTLTWDDFRHRTSMGDIRTFSLEMEASELDPTNGRPIPSG